MEGQETYLRVGIDASSAQTGARVVKRSLDDISNSADHTHNRLLHMKEALFGLAGAAVGVYGISTAIQAIGNYAKESLNYLGLIETSTLGIASSFLVSGQYVNRTTKTVLEGQQALRAAQADSVKVIEQLRYANLQTIATLDELIIAYQTTLPVAMARGFDKTQVMEFTKTMVQAAGAIGLPFNQMAEETRSLLVDGAINPRNSRIATVLGLRSSDIAEYKGNAQGLYDFLMKRLEGFAVAGKASMDTWKGLWSNLKDMSQQISGKMFEGMFDGVKEQLQAITKSMFTIDDKQKTMTMNPQWEASMKSLGKTITDVFRNVVDGTKWIYEHWQQIKLVGEAFVVYKVAMVLAESAQKLFLVGTQQAVVAQTAQRQSIFSVFEAETMRLTQTKLAMELSAKKALATQAETQQELGRATALKQGLAAEQAVHNARLNGLNLNVAVAAAQKRLVAEQASTQIAAAQANLIEANSRKFAVTQHLALIETEMAALQAKGIITKQDALFEKELRFQQFTNTNKLVVLNHELAVAENELSLAKRNGTAATISATAAENLAIAAKQKAINTSARYGIQILAAKEQEIAANIAARAAQQAATAAVNQHTVSIAAATLASRAYVAVKGVLARALLALGGPIGAITTLLMLGATAWMIWGNKSKTAADDAELGLTGVNRKLKEQIEKLEEIERIKNGPKGTSDTEIAKGYLDNEQLKQWEASVKRADDLRDKLTPLGGPATSFKKSYSVHGEKDNEAIKRENLTMLLRQELGVQKEMVSLVERKKALEAKQAADYNPTPPKKDESGAEKAQKDIDKIAKYNQEQDTKLLDIKRKNQEASDKQALENIKNQSAAEITLLENKYSVFAISQREYEQKVYESQARVVIAERENAAKAVRLIQAEMKEVDKDYNNTPTGTNRQIEIKNELGEKYNKLIGEETDAQTALNAAVAREVDLRDKNTGRVAALDATEGIALAQAKANLLAIEGGELAAQAAKDAADLRTINNDELRVIQEKINKETQLRDIREMANENRSAKASMAGMNPLGDFDNESAAKENALAVEAEAHRQMLEMIDRRIAAELKLQEEQTTTAENAIYSIMRVNELMKAADIEKAVSAQKTAKIKMDYDKAMWTSVFNQAKKTVPQLAALDGFLALQFKQYEKDKLDSTKLSTRGQMQMVGDYAGAAGQAFASLADSQDQSSRKGFETAKMFNMGAAIMSTASAIITQLSGPDGWTPAAWARSAIAGVLGAVQVAKIASTSFGGGGSVSNGPSAGSFGGSGASMGSVGGSIGARYTSTRDSQSQEVLQSIAGSMENASLAIGKVADGLTKITDLFKDGSFLSLAAGSAPGMYGKTGTAEAGGWFKATTGLNSFTGFTDPLTVFKNIGSAVFGIGNKYKTTGGGFTLGLEGDDVLSRNYVDQKKAGSWISSSKKRTKYSDGDVDFIASVQSAVNQITGTIIRSAVATGTSADFSQAAIKEMKIKTSGRKPEDIQKDMEKWFTDASNALAKTVVGLQEFAFYGENAFDALVRLSTSLQSTNEALELIGARLITSTLAGANAAYKLQDMMGGAEKFTDSVDTYFTTMYTEAEQDAMRLSQATRQVQVAFREMNLAVPKTRDEFKTLVNGLNLTTEGGAKTFASLMDIAAAFGTMTDKATEAAKSMVDKTVDIMLNAAMTLKDIMSGPLSTKSPEELYKEQQILFATALANGRAAEIPDLSKSLLEASRAYNASGSGYIRDYNAVIEALGGIAGIDGTPTLTSAERQVQLLSDMKDGVEGRLDKVVEKLAALETALVNIETTTRLVVNS